jgi:hypothetical protein
MNPAKLNKRITFYSFDYTSNTETELFKVWSQKIVKSKRRDDGQNGEQYQFIIRKKAGIVPYLTIVCNGESFIVFTAEEKEPGYLTLQCEKSKVHSFYDRCTVKRMSEVEKGNGASGFALSAVHIDIPCELIQLQSDSAEQTEQQQDLDYRYELHIENKYTLIPGDELEVKHKQDTYKARVTSYFRTHTHQEVAILIEDDA